MYPKLASKPELQPGSIALVAVGYGNQGVDGFLGAGAWRGGPLYVDPEPADKKAKPALFAHFGTGSKGVMGLFSRKVISATYNAKNKSDTSKAGGNQWNLGGTVVLDARDGSVVFAHRQKGFADHPDLDAMLAACEAALGSAPAAPAGEAACGGGGGGGDDDVAASAASSAAASS